ncbi:ArsR/SmtB family transcription factor [Staphylococcus pettenkoferi]|uniref:ArsR/SmtB family transcription factor n=2 Tax=Staphylococcus pettenkoferi TaxID=170573 RepID=UPI0028D7967B|nr:winged helix-turn-helix domain-containing protein [Staphylococcus pettenkoferi]
MIKSESREDETMYSDFAENILLIGHKTRLTMLIELSSGKALPAGELARLAHVKPQTASEHLSKLVKANLISVESWGRHRYYKITNDKIIKAINALAVISPSINNNSLRETTKKEKLSYMRSCYGHLAGKIGVRFTESLLENGYLKEFEEYYILTQEGKDWFKLIGLEIEKSMYTKPIPKHIDWTERKYHIAGPVALRITRQLFKLSWIYETDTNRCLEITRKGKEAFEKYLGMDVCE